MAGLIVRYFTDELLGLIVDPRNVRGRRWKSCLPLLKALFLGLACGCKGLKEVEEMTAEMPRAVRKTLGIPKRIPDTTLRDLLCELDPEDLLRVLYVVGYTKWRQKALHQLESFPFGVLSQDGKYPAVRDVGDEEGGVYEYLQVHHDDDGNATHGLVRTITSTLVTAVGRPILGAVPVRGLTNEMGTFQKSFGDMVRIYGRLFRLVMFDAGATSEPNAKAVLRAGKHYFFLVANPKWVMHQTIELLLRDKAPAARHVEVISSRKHVVRELTLLPVKETKKNLTLWAHTRTIFKITSETYEDGELKSTRTRYAVSSMETSVLPADKWLELAVLRWGVETSHQILDKAFEEDKRPWISKDAQGSLVVMIARRGVYTILTLFKSVTLRSEENHELPWRKLMEWCKDMTKWPNPEELEGLRTGKFAVPPALA